MASRQRTRKLEETIASRIKAFRQATGLTQEQLSEEAGIAPQYLSRLENAHQVPSLHTIVALAEALCTTPSVLLAEPRGDTRAELVSRITAVLDGLSQKDAAFLELQISAWAAQLKEKG